MPVFLAPWGRGRGPSCEAGWEGEGEQVSQLNHLIPLILPSFAWAPPSPRWGEEKEFRLSVDPLEVPDHKGIGFTIGDALLRQLQPHFK